MKFFFFLIFGFAIASDAQQFYYVSPSGNDENPGTADKPFQTLFKARDHLIGHHLYMNKDIVIYLREGVYPFDRTFQLLYPNSGTNGYTITYCSYPGERAVISGGMKVTGWKPYKKGIYKATVNLPGFRQLYVNGRLAIRSRGFLVRGAESFGDLSEPNARVGFKISNTAITGWKNPGDMELILVMTWCHMIAKIDTIVREGDSAAILMKQPLYYYLVNKPGRNDRYVDRIENAMELVDEPNEWYFDRHDKVLYFLPPKDFDMQKAEIIAPAVERLVSVKGTPANPVKNVTFKDIVFVYGNWLQPSEIGHPDIQANVTRWIPGYGYRHTEYFKYQPGDAMKSMANIGVSFGHNIRFIHCGFSKLGGAGLDIGRGSQNCLVEGCWFTHIAGNGLMIGDVRHPDHHPSDSSFIALNNIVRNCYISHAAFDYQGGVGIFAGYTINTQILNNEICNLPYTGISMGWGWGEFDYPNYSKTAFVMYMYPASSEKNRIENNHIHHVMQVRQDGGAVYTLGRMPGTVICENYIHSNPRSHDIYLDEGSAGISVLRNVIIPERQQAFDQIIKLNNPPDELKQSCKVHENFIVSPDQISEEVHSIIRKSGIRDSAVLKIIQGMK